MPVALSTWSRAERCSPGDVCRRAAAVGAPALALDGTAGDAWGVELAAARGDLPVLAVEAPRGERVPLLASEDREERRAAVAAVGARARLAADLGARLLIVRLGALRLQPEWERTTRAFARREPIPVDRLVALRTQLSPRALDLARLGLDPLLEHAIAANVTIAIANRARWWEIPDAIELSALLADFGGAPLRPFYDAAAGHARELLGFGSVGEWMALHGAACAGAFLTDACGLRGGLPWGRGEVDHAAVLSALPADALWIVHCAPGATDEELASAIARS